MLQSECTVLTACASTFVVYFNVSVVLSKIKLPPKNGRHCFELNESVVLSPLSYISKKINGFRQSHFM